MSMGLHYMIQRKVHTPVTQDVLASFPGFDRLQYAIMEGYITFCKL